MKILFAIAIAALLLAPASSTQAIDAGTPEVATLPEHGSVWFGSGLARYVTTGEQPLHGSVWFGNGLSQYGVDTSLVNSFDTAMIARGPAQGWVSVQRARVEPEPVNSFDVAMIVCGACNQHVDREWIYGALAVSP